MIRSIKLQKLCVALSTLLLSPISFATFSRSGTIGFAPAQVSPIPTLSEALLITMGLVLLVVAFRFIRSEGVAAKSVAAILFTGGLVVGGHGIDRSIATSEHTIDANECKVGGTHNFGADRFNAVTNACPNTMEVISLQCASPNYSGISNPPCRVGTILSAEGGVCDTPMCDGVPVP